MKHFFTQQKTKVLVIIVLVLLFIFALLLIKSINTQGASRLFLFKPHRRHPVSVDDVTRIAGWMTFEYINKLFNIPDSYLKDSLHIQDEKYPVITIKQYTQKNGIDTVQFVSQIKEQIDVYLSKSKVQ